MSSDRVEVLPATEFDESRYQSGSDLWVRISAFLSAKAPTTRDTYRGILREWCEFMGAAPGTAEGARILTSVTDVHALAYRQWLEDRPGQKPRMVTTASKSKEVSTARRKARKSDGTQATLSNATIAKKLAALRRIYKSLLGANLGLKTNPFDSDSVPSPASRSGQKRPTEMIPFKKVNEILAGPDPSTSKGLRDKAALTLLFGGGLRRSEVVALRVGDVRKTPAGTDYVYLRATKGKRDAQQALPPWAAKPVWDLVRARRSEGAQDGDYLVVSFRGPGGNSATPLPLSAHGLYHLFKRYCMLAGAGSVVTPHSARATAITRLLDAGYSHREVQEFSRHASVQMVEVYDKRRLDTDESPGRELDFD